MFKTIQNWFSFRDTEIFIESEDFSIPDWPDQNFRWENEVLNLLLADATTQQSQHVTTEQIIENSENFPIKFPIDPVRCICLVDMVTRGTLEFYINSVYPVLHEHVLLLCCKFLLHKRQFGHDPERKLYANMSLLQFVERLISKRAVSFVGGHDFHMLLDGSDGLGKWELIGTTEETEKLNLRDCLSYDEIKLSAFLSVSSYTRFINDGNRHNKGVVNLTNVECDGIIVGLIGPRLSKAGAMEYQEVLIADHQNHLKTGYGKQRVPTVHTMFAEFYEEPCFTYRQLANHENRANSRFKRVREGVFFDNMVYCKRLALSFDTLLVEANQRAKEKNTSAFIHVVGIGLGVWRCSPHQESLFLDTFAKRIQVLGDNLHSVSDIVFGYFSDEAACGGYKDGDIFPIAGHPKNGINIYISKRQPHLKLSGEGEDKKLLVVSYAWDGNALPGNEFWGGSLHTSSDPAAASSTQVAELHNPHINPKLCADNLRIVTPSGVLTYGDYCKRIKDKEN